MASPDTTPYVDLRIEDKDPQDVFDLAVADLQTKLPEWVPRETNTEVLLLQSLALAVSEAIFAINRLPDGVTEILLKLFGIERDSGAPPEAQLQFNMVGTAGYTVPAGTQARLEVPGGADPIVFTTDVELTIASGNQSGVVAATGDRFTSEANGIVAGTLLELLDSVISVESVELDTDVTDGRDEESDAEYFDRAVARFGRLTDTLVLPRHFVSAALEHTFVIRALAIDNWDGTGATPGTVAGHITVAVYGPDRFNTAPEKAEVLAALEDASIAQLAVHVIDPSITNVNVTVQVQGLAGYDAPAIIDSVTTALEDYLSPLTWQWGSVVRYTEIVTLINNAEGVDYIITINPPTADVVLSGNAPLANAGTITVTVVEA